MRFDLQFKKKWERIESVITTQVPQPLQKSVVKDRTFSSAEELKSRVIKNFAENKVSTLASGEELVETENAGRDGMGRMLANIGKVTVDKAILRAIAELKAEAVAVNCLPIDGEKANSMFSAGSFSEQSASAEPHQGLPIKGSEHNFQPASETTKHPSDHADFPQTARKQTHETNLSSTQRVNIYTNINSETGGKSISDTYITASHSVKAQEVNACNRGSLQKMRLRFCEGAVKIFLDAMGLQDKSNFNEMPMKNFRDEKYNPVIVSKSSKNSMAFNADLECTATEMDKKKQIPTEDFSIVLGSASQIDYAKISRMPVADLATITRLNTAHRGLEVDFKIGGTTDDMHAAHYSL